MLSRLSMLAAVAASLTLLPASWAVAQTPGSISGLSAKSSLTPDEKTKINSYATWWTEQLHDSAGDQDTLRKARRQLRTPLRSASPIFRNEYSRALLPELERIIDGSEIHLAVNGIILLAELETDRALSELLDRCSIDEQRWQIRLRAASGCRMLIERSDLAENQPKKITSAARRLRTIVRDEDNPLVLRHTLQALLAADHEDLAENYQNAVRGYIVEALNQIADRAKATVEAAAAKDQLDAIIETLNGLRTHVLTMPPNAQGGYGKKLAPALAALLDVASTHWQDMQADDQIRRQCGSLITICESMLERLDPVVRPTPPIPRPTTNMRKAWDERDRDRYNSDLNSWTRILDQPPYE
jgi:hypothetical protein